MRTFSTMLPYLNGMLGQGIQVMVREMDLERVKEILIEKENAGKIVKCPNWGSSNIGFGMRGKKRVGERLLIFLSV